MGVTVSEDVICVNNDNNTASLIVGNELDRTLSRYGCGVHIT